MSDAFEDCSSFMHGFVRRRTGPALQAARVERLRDFVALWQQIAGYVQTPWHRYYRP